MRKYSNLGRDNIYSFKIYSILNSKYSYAAIRDFNTLLFLLSISDWLALIIIIIISSDENYFIIFLFSF